MKYDNPLLMASVRKLSLEELEVFERFVHDELVERHRIQKEELIEKLCDASNNLLHDYPNTSFWTKAICPECNTIFSLDAFETHKHNPLSVVDFS